MFLVLSTYASIYFSYHIACFEYFSQQSLVSCVTFRSSIYGVTVLGCFCMACQRKCMFSHSAVAKCLFSLITRSLVPRYRHPEPTGNLPSSASVSLAFSALPSHRQFFCRRARHHARQPFYLNRTTGSYSGIHLP